MARILIVEDEGALRVALADILAESGHRILTAADGETGLEAALEQKPDLILLDIMLPKIDGFAVCAELRRRGRETPVLMLTAKSQVDDRVRGLDAGADDYLVKPFSTRELLARVRALIRRSERENGSIPDLLRLGDLEIDFRRQECRRGRRAIELSAREFAMLRLMAERAGEPVSREDFLDRVWEYSAFPSTRTVDNHVAALRRKIETRPAEPRWIKTVQRVGYRLDWDHAD